MPTTPGWYKDPSGQAKHEAYWDGEKWTGATRRPENLGSVGPPLQAPPPRSRPWLVAGGVLLIAGSVLPWAQAGIFSVPGTSGDGALTLIVGVILGVLGFVRPSSAIHGITAIILSVGSLWIVGNVLNNLATTPQNVGAGLLVAGLGGLLGIIGGVVSLDDRMRKPS